MCPLTHRMCTIEFKCASEEPTELMHWINTSSMILEIFHFEYLLITIEKNVNLNNFSSFFSFFRL